MGRKVAIAIFLGLAAFFLMQAVGSASAATTIGATQVGTPTTKPVNCTVVTDSVPVDCTLFITSFSDPAEAAPAGLYAPADGAITRWHVTVGAGTTTSLTFKPRVFGVGVGGYSALRTGESQSIPAAGGTFSFDTHLSISAGDFFAIDSIADGPVGAGPTVISTTAAIARYVQKSPAVPDGTSFTVAISLGSPMTKLMISADIEPDADHDSYGDETQDLCPTRADVHTACPPPAVTNAKTIKGGFTFTSDIAAKATTTLFRTSNGRKVGKKCKAKRTSGKKCKIYTKFAQWDNDVVAGVNKISYAYKVGGKSLKRGNYRATILVTSPQNTMTTKTIDFKIK